MRNALCWLLALVGTAATTVAVATVVAEVRKRPPGPPLGFNGGRLIVPFVMRPGEEYDVPVRILNSGTESARLIGALEYCGGACYSVRGLPVTIPPKGDNRVLLHVKANAPGSLDEDVTFYTDRPEQPTLVLKVQGTIEDAGHETAAQSPTP
jgi:hypothetical protein